jgi:membrane-bound serine protease (ClpP class)
VPPASITETLTTEGADAGVATTSGVRVGDQGVADSTLRPAGRVRFGDNYADVVADGFVESGRPVRVIRISGNRIVVREV